MVLAFFVAVFAGAGVAIPYTTTPVLTGSLSVSSLDFAFLGIKNKIPFR